MKPYLIDVPVKVNIWTRPECQRKQFEVIKQARPSILFVTSDGGRNEREWQLIYQNRKISNKPNASEELEELYKKYGNGRTSQPQNTIETFKLIFKTPLIQGSRNSYNATVVDAENNEYTLIIWSNKVNELKSRGIFEDLLKASQLRQKFTVKGTLQIYAPKR